MSRSSLGWRKRGIATFGAFDREVPDWNAVGAERGGLGLPIEGEGIEECVYCLEMGTSKAVAFRFAALSDGLLCILLCHHMILLDNSQVHSPRLPLCLLTMQQRIQFVFLLFANPFYGRCYA